MFQMNAIYSRHGFESWGSIISTSRVNTMDASHNLCMHGAGLAPQSQCWMVHRQTLVCTCTCVLSMQLLSMSAPRHLTHFGAHLHSQPHLIAVACMVLSKQQYSMVRDLCGGISCNRDHSVQVAVLLALLRVGVDHKGTTDAQT